MGRDEPQLAIRDFRARLEQEFPDKRIPKATATHKIFKGMVSKGPAFWESVIWCDETVNAVLKLKGKVSKY